MPMQGSLTRQFDDQSTAAFVQRCSAIGVAPYFASSDGLLAYAGANDAAGADWLASPPIARRVTQAIAQATQTASEIDPGLWLITLPDEAGHQKPCAVLALSQDAGSGPGFNHDCDEAGLDAAQVRQSIASIKRHSPGGLEATGETLTWMLSDLRQLDQKNFALDDLTDQLGQSYENITLMYRLGRSMSSHESPRKVAESICHQLRDSQEFGWVAARFRDNDDGVDDLSDQCLIAGDLPCDPKRFAEELDRLIRGEEGDSWSKYLELGKSPLADLAGSELVMDTILHDGQAIGAVVVGNKTGNDPDASSNDTQLVDAIAGFFGAFHENAARFSEQRKMFIGTLEAVSTALDAKDRYTHGHSERVAHLAVQLARAIGIDEEEVERIHIAGLVHDVGKIGVPEAVLCKTGKLTAEEYDQIKKHPRIGYNILKGIPKMEDVLDGVLYHHERWDGRGYPDKLSGENIPLYGRILGVADTFDAMSSTRSYRRAMPRPQVLEEILKCSGTQFDPELTGPFVALDFSEFDDLVRTHQGMSSKAA